MKQQIFNTEVSAKLRRMGRKTRSHGTYRAKRKPNSNRVRVNSHDNPQYHLVK